ncbi:MAG: hypothetical protein ACFE8M_02820 [Candidatus Hermodarchaeota archaeon]
MVQFFTKFLQEENLTTKKKEKNTTKSLLQYQYIWEKQPSRKDISMKHALSKTSFLLIIGFLFMVTTYLLSHNVYLAIGLTVILEIGFSLVFYDAFFILRGKSTFRPLKDIIFWQIKEDQSSLYYTNYKDLLTVGMKIFSIEVMAENVHPSLIHFLKAFSDINEYIPFTYQVVHTKKKSGALKTYIYIIVFSSTHGTLNSRRIGELNEQLFHYGAKLKSLFASDYHHFHVTSLKGNAIIGAIRSSLLQEDFDDVPIEVPTTNTLNKKTTFLRTIFISIVLVIFNTYFALLSLPILFILFFNIIFIPTLLIIWWKNIVFQLFSAKFFNYQEISVVYPFQNVTFYLSNRIPDILFAHVDNKELIGLKMYTVNKVLKPPFGSFSKFFSGVNRYQLPFTYTTITRPLSFAEMDKEYGKEIRDEVRDFIVRRLLNDEDRYNWLDRRAGIWESIFSLSTSFRVPTQHVSTKAISIISEQLYKAGTVLLETFRSNFKRFQLIKLHKQLLESGFQCELVKNNHIYSNGSHLWHIIYQGTALMSIITIPNELKKGVNVQIAAEFNTPLYLDNFIEIGRAFNTETLRAEVPAGFLFDQLHSVLITNGTNFDRELLNMKMAAELIKKEIPCLIFDFTGRWSKLLKYFQNTKYQDNILYFKLGKAFTLDPVESEIPYENDNIKYLEYMFDAYAMSFKKDDHFMHTFKNKIRQYGGNLNAAKIGLQHKPEYEKNATDEEILSTLSDISQEDLAFLHISEKGVVKVHEFINTHHTVIVDISISRDYKTLCYFMLLITSKLIRYCGNSTQYFSKFIFLPHVDILFQNNYLDKVANYGLIDKFLDPLQENNFGIICSANEIRYLHPNIFKFLSNLVTFRTTDSRDIAILSNLLNLNELHGMGYYSSTRNENYQIHFLRNMKRNQVLMKRSDVDQSFPVLLQIEELNNAKVMEYHEIVSHMDAQGYDLKFSEKWILSLAHETKFKRDLGEYIEYLNELIRFFKQIKVVQNVAGLYERKVKKLLLEYLHPKLSQHYSQNKKLMIMIRDTIYKILRKYDYLVEDHPRAAGGGQSTRTCLIIGPAYEKAIQEYYEVKARDPAHIVFNVIEKESSGTSRFLTPKLSSETEVNLRNTLLINFNGKMVRNLININSSIENKQYAKSLKMLKKFVPDYFKNCYRHFYHPDNEITKRNIFEFIKLISDVKDFPFYADELSNLFEKCEQIEVKSNNLEQLSHEIYNLVYNFYIRLKKFLNR